MRFWYEFDSRKYLSLGAHYKDRAGFVWWFINREWLGAEMVFRAWLCGKDRISLRLPLWRSA